MPGGGKRAGVDDLVLWRIQPTPLSFVRKYLLSARGEYVSLNRSALFSALFCRRFCRDSLGVRWPRDNNNFFFLWVGSRDRWCFVVTSLIIGRDMFCQLCVSASGVHALYVSQNLESRFWRIRFKIR